MSQPDKRVTKILGPDPMKPRPVQAAFPMDKAIQLLVSGLTRIQEHGGWRIRQQDTNSVTAEIEYRSGTRGVGDHLKKIKFHAQFHSIGQQTEISWQYEDDSLTKDIDLLWHGLCNLTNSAILACLELI
jgi:hypothetical protein